VWRAPWDEAKARRDRIVRSRLWRAEGISKNGRPPLMKKIARLRRCNFPSHGAESDAVALVGKQSARFKSVLQLLVAG
jgi:hypothetical protein